MDLQSDALSSALASTVDLYEKQLLAYHTKVCNAAVAEKHFLSCAKNKNEDQPAHARRDG